MKTDEHRHEHPPLAGRAKIAWIVFAVIAAFYLWTGHRAHLLGVLPFLLLLACPLMHLFMHGGHGHGHGHDGKQPPPGDDK
ncbi:MAG: hypothetical protein A3H93_11615 [Rhodocyclales bacterium RIFCSPLOWO2_02_FULL_63_24]|nr:MAG: hypothetical protein A2040_00295 [Rhodocyclales bacterium GWA2_65_19]OHC71087.1 MAG: hypothetical protein A3H93_11615 [Rhodocyclales bacterium RIFCSPLOWO2_02_FULL_63_24]